MERRSDFYKRPDVLFTLVTWSGYAGTTGISVAMKITNAANVTAFNEKLIEAALIASVCGFIAAGLNLENKRYLVK